MEANTADYDEYPKTPRRTRRSSVHSTESTSQTKRSAKKSALNEIHEVFEETPSKTPSRASRILGFQTPSRSEALTDAQTPRRSVRKSIKPVQEYENIVAQKGLNAKRAASSSVEDVDEMSEGKWEPAVIGRISSKRSKKAKRVKGKQLKRQHRIEDDGDRVEHDWKIKEEIEVKEDFEAQETVESSISGKPEGVTDQASTDSTSCVEQTKSASIDDDDGKVEHQLESKVSQEESKEREIQELPSIENTLQNSLRKADESDISMADGDVELAAIPITADDCVDDIKPPTDTSPLQEAAEQCIEVREISSPSTESASASDAASRADDSDCIMLSLNESSQTDRSVCEPEKIEANSKSNHDSEVSVDTNMPSLLLSDDEEDVTDTTPKDENENEQQILASSTHIEAELKLSNEETPIGGEDEGDLNLNSTFDADEAASTPKVNADQVESHIAILRTSTSRTPTPFKSKKPIIPDIIVEPEEETETEKAPEVLIEPREASLKGSRKRSFSICTDRPKKMVTFHSPANTMVSIYDDDLMDSAQKNCNKENHVTKRRKRSLSVTETDREVIAYFKNRKPIDETPDKRKKAAQAGSRIKMPNFAAIHQQHFQRMESISDHIARKAERAKIISHSATKVRPTSIQKGMPVKNSILRDFNKESMANRSALPVPKARQKIELTGIEHKPKIVRSKSKQDLVALDDLPSIGNISSKFSFSATTLSTSGIAKPTLPKPTVQSLALSKSITALKPTTSHTTIAVAHSHSTVHDSRPRFNLSTAVDSTQMPKSSDKLNDRRKRLMDMYKSRNVSRNGDKGREILKGVRTNRRFELQMMCRNRPN